MANVIPFDRNNPSVLLRSCINSINKSIMLHSEDIIEQSSHLRRLYKTYDKVFDFVHRLSMEMLSQFQKIHPEVRIRMIG